MKFSQSRRVAYLATAFLAAAIFAFTASRLKLAPSCIGGIAVIASFSTTSWTSTKRQNSYLYHSQYCGDPPLVRPSGKPVRSNGSRRRLIMLGTSVRLPMTRGPHISFFRVSVFLSAGEQRQVN